MISSDVVAGGQFLLTEWLVMPFLQNFICQFKTVNLLIKMGKYPPSSYMQQR